MKKLIFGLFIVVSILGLLSCESGLDTFDPQKGNLGENALAKRHGHSRPACPATGEFAGFNEQSPNYGVYNYTLWGNQNIDVGDVTITNDDDNIYVTYTTDGTAELYKVYVYVWTSLDDIPDRRPPPGHADYSANHINALSHTVVIPRDSYSGDTFYITANAKLRGVVDEDDDEDDEDDDRHGRRGRGHRGHHNLKAYAGDAFSPDCFDDAGRHWWSYVGYTSESYASVSGKVYDDENSSGDFNTGEAGFEGILVTASGSDGYMYTAFTDLDGAYLFEHLLTGLDYTIISGVPAGDYDASENGTGAIIADLTDDGAQVNFGFASSITLSDCGVTFSLWADQTTDAGTLTIANDNDNLYITFDTNELGDLAVVHVNIGTTDLRAIGDPANYNANIFVDNSSFPLDSYTVTIPLADVGFTCSDLMVVKAHAILTTDGASGSTAVEASTAFGGETYYPPGKTDWFYDTAYYSCCVISTPQ